MSVDEEQLWRSLSEAGEKKVLENLTQKIYGEAKIPLVEEWLDQQEASRHAIHVTAQAGRPLSGSHSV